MVDSVDRPLSQVGTRRKRCPGQFGQDGMGSIPATPSTKHASCFPPSSVPASIEISIKLVVCLDSVARDNLADSLMPQDRRCLPYPHSTGPGLTRLGAGL